MVIQKKSLGQHWLKDRQTLEAIVEYAEIHKTDTVLEIGPGLGTLTKYLTGQAGHVVAVEIDSDLANNLSQSAPQNLQVVQGNILKFDPSSLPAAYKVVANIPYYLTSNLIKTLAESSNPPVRMVLLVQKEVAQRICAETGQMSLLSISVQLYYRPELGVSVPAASFDPPPKVDSQVVVLARRPKPLFHQLDTGLFFRVVKAGFSAKRKKLASSLAGGLGISKTAARQVLEEAGVDSDLRAQNLSLEDWHRVYRATRF